MTTVYSKPETNSNHIEDSDNLNSGQIVEYIFSLESNKDDTPNVKKEASTIGLTPEKLYTLTKQ